MTNEEAIKILDQMPIAASFNFTFEEMAEALQMATKSLKNERPHGECKSCRHRDPEDKKCDCGGWERISCNFSVSDDYFCKYYEQGKEEQKKEGAEE